MRSASLPVFLPKSAPTVDRVRSQLGGRAVSEPGVGAPVTTASTSGVVVFASSGILHVLSPSGLVTKVSAAACAPLLNPNEELVALSADACAFAALGERQRVSYAATDGAVASGVLVEKCRYGAIVEASDGRLLGVGFRKLWSPVPASDAS